MNRSISIDNRGEDTAGSADAARSSVAGARCLARGPRPSVLSSRCLLILPRVSLVAADREDHSGGHSQSVRPIAGFGRQQIRPSRENKLVLASDAKADPVAGPEADTAPYVKRGVGRALRPMGTVMRHADEKLPEHRSPTRSPVEPRTGRELV